MRQKQARPVRRPENTGNPERTGSPFLKLSFCILALCAAGLIQAGKTGALDALMSSFKARVAFVMAYMSGENEPVSSVPKPRPKPKPEPESEPAPKTDQETLAELFALGKECYAHDKKRAAAWFSKAAKRGHVEAQCRLADMYARAEGVEEDMALALEWFRRAGEQGNATAQYKVGLMCMEGAGQPQDMAQAAQWFHMPRAWACRGMRRRRWTGSARPPRRAMPRRSTILASCMRGARSCRRI